MRSKGCEYHPRDSCLRNENQKTTHVLLPGLVNREVLGKKKKKTFQTFVVQINLYCRYWFTFYKEKKKRKENNNIFSGHKQYVIRKHLNA